jgi:hypothetical protein
VRQRRSTRNAQPFHAVRPAEDRLAEVRPLEVLAPLRRAVVRPGAVAARNRRTQP